MNKSIELSEWVIAMVNESTRWIRLRYTWRKNERREKLQLLSYEHSWKRMIHKRKGLQYNHTFFIHLSRAHPVHS